MARKAVQGYTDKSYYDNTRFLGMLAHTDPNNEGAFRHIVNFDYADTGQSVTPRQGYLTTILVKRNGSYYYLHPNSFLFKDPVSNLHVVYNLQKHGDQERGGVLVNLSAYNINLEENKYLIPIKHEIMNYDYDDVYQYLFTALPTLKASYESSNDKETFKQEILDRITLAQEAHNLLTIRDINLIRKNLVRVNFSYKNTEGVLGDDDYDLSFMLEVYYRKDTVEEFEGDTLVFSVVNTQQHPSLTDRNIASATNIIPLTVDDVNYNGVIQRVYTADNRPDGLVNYVAPNLYVSSVGTTPIKYYYDTLYKHERYMFRPHFELNPANHLNSDNTKTHWAYQVEILNTQPNSKLPTRFISPWFDYEYNSRIFPTFSNVDDTKAPNVVDRHYHDCTALIVMVPKENNLHAEVPPLNAEPSPSNIIKYPVQRFVERVYTSSNRVVLDNVAATMPMSIIGTLEYYPRYHILNNAYNINLRAAALFEDVSNHQEFIKRLNDNISHYNDVLFYVDFFNNAELVRPGMVHPLVYPAGYSDSVKEYENLNSIYNDVNYMNAVVSTADGTNNVVDNVSSHMYTGAELLELFYKGVFNGRNIQLKCLPVRYPAERKYHDDNNNHTHTEYVNVFAPLDRFGKIVETGSTVPSFLGPLVTKRLLDAYHYTAGHEQFIRLYRGSTVIQIDTAVLHNSPQLPFAADGGVNHPFFESGYRITVNMRTYNEDEVEGRSYHETKQLQEAWGMSAYKASINARFGLDDTQVRTITEYFTREPKEIAESKKYIVYDDSMLVVWHGNRVYISQEGNYFDFRQDGMQEFGEEVVKVIQYKNILLVFTVQHLYAVFKQHIESTYIDDNDKEVVTTTSFWSQQTVLYNILVDPKYADVIQIFNQMVLFYSADGQMFMIKPSTQIDSETLFSLQYFNKSVNDVLQNYDKYINERLAMYQAGAEPINKEDVNVKAQVSVNSIKIIYTVPNVITYIVIYDVINNRYKTYDTLTFTDVCDRFYVDSGDMYLTHDKGFLYFTTPYTEPQHPNNYCDMSFLTEFKRNGINSYIDTGDLNLNNHLRKRFRDLYVTFRNLSTDKLLYTVETEIDGIVDMPFYDKEFEVQDSSGRTQHVAVSKFKLDDKEYTIKEVIAERSYDIVEIDGLQYLNDKAEGSINQRLDEDDTLMFDLNEERFENNNLLFDFKDYNSSAIITHKSSIIGNGKTLRLKFQFVSRGKYKIQGFGIVYKERRI